MDLELRILKEKVVEDEKNSGIGSLFNDEKNQHQHIAELKVKYQQMKLDYDKRLQDTEKQKLKVLEDQFYYDSQIKVKTEMNEAKEKTFEDYQS